MHHPDIRGAHRRTRVEVSRGDQHRRGSLAGASVGLQREQAGQHEQRRRDDPAEEYAARTATAEPRPAATVHTGVELVHQVVERVRMLGHCGVDCHVADIKQGAPARKFSGREPVDNYPVWITGG